MRIAVGGRGRLDQPHVADSEVLARARDRPQVGGKERPDNDDPETARVHARNYQAGVGFIGER